MNENEFEDIRPYTDAEAVEALARMSRHPMMPVVSKYLFPSVPASAMSHMLRGIGSIDQFQNEVMMGVIDGILARTSDGFTCSGIEHLKGIQGRFLAVSNHRDIVLDPALIQYVMKQAGLPFTEICVGSNLVTSQLLEDLLRSNRMIKVIRGIKARELYLSSQRLSQYIRERITSGGASIWIAQREGRTKNGLDTQGLLKMFDMSGTGTFEENFRELNIVPMSISYEYESCDARKAREVLLRREGPYIKKEDEDLHSILTGIRQAKGHIHLEIEEPLTAEEIFEASKCVREIHRPQARQTRATARQGGAAQDLPWHLRRSGGREAGALGPLPRLLHNLYYVKLPLGNEPPIGRNSYPGRLCTRGPGCRPCRTRAR